MLIHRFHNKIVSLQCIRMCLFKEELSENADIQTLQENGFSPVCVRMWVFKCVS